MTTIRNFFESSTIHGLTYIATSRKYVRLFWIIVVIAGFSVAGVLIYNSFQSWDESPVKTTIETHPISEIKFPKMTVCPPKNTFTDLNFYLKIAENMTLTNNTREELYNYAKELMMDQLYDDIMTDIHMLEDNDRYYNWYHGFTEMRLPYYESFNSHLKYFVVTTATSGTITTQNYGQRFDVEKVVTDIFYRVDVREAVK